MSELVTDDFNYGSVDPDTAAKLEYFAKSGKALIKKSNIEFIATFGEILSGARKLLASHNKNEGTFVKWATAEFDIGKQSIYNYVNAWDRILSSGWTTYVNWSPTALYLASADDFPKLVMKKLEKIPSTDLVRTSDVKRLIEASKPKTDATVLTSDTASDVPFDAAPETPASKAAAKAAEKAAADAVKAKAKADAAAAMAKAREDATVAREAAKAAKAAEKAEKEAAKAKEKADKEAARAAALTKEGQIKNLKNLIQQHIDKAVRYVDDLARLKPTSNATKMAIIRTLQGVKTW